MNKKNDWIQYTKDRLAKHKLLGKPMDYVIPLNKNTYCSGCGELLKKGMEVVHRYDGGEYTVILC